MEAKRLSELPSAEAQDILIGMLSGHNKECEIETIIAVFTGYSLMLDTARDLGLLELDSSEIIELVRNGIKGETQFEEQQTWLIIEKTIGYDKVLEIIDNHKFYIELYNEIMHNIQSITDTSLSLFSKIHK